MTATPILVVDDDAAVREALVQTLELAEFRAVPAGSFVAAKDQITRDFGGVILSDIRMPGRDGFHLLFQTPATTGLNLLLYILQRQQTGGVQMPEGQVIVLIHQPLLICQTFQHHIVYTAVQLSGQLLV